MTTHLTQQQKEQDNNNFKHEITIDRVACPLHVLQMKKGMKQVKQGETLKINSTAYAAPELLAAARQIGSEVTINNNNELYIVR